MASQKLVEDLLSQISDMSGIDTHEHIRRMTSLREEGQNIYTSFKYSLLQFDLVTAGMDPEFWETPSKEPREAWKKIRPYLYRVKNTAFFQTLLMAYKDLFGFSYNEITDNNWEELSDRIAEAYRHNGWYSRVIKDILKKEFTLIDIYWDPWSFDVDSNLFVPVQRIDYFLFLRSGKYLPSSTIGNVSMKEVACKLGINLTEYVNTLDDYEVLLNTAIKTAVKERSPCVKIAVSYNRGLHFEKVEKDTVRHIFRKDDDDITAEEAKKVEDYILHCLVKKCIEYDMPIQIHTGTQGGITSKLRNTDPLDLNNLFLTYPDAKFVLFHMGFPYSTEVALLAKTFPNVYLDVCWMSWYAFGSSFKHRLKEWLALVPYTKIMAGGDCENVERMYAAMITLNQQLAEVLAENIDCGLYDKSLCLQIAKNILYDNAVNVYTKLGKK